VGVYPGSIPGRQMALQPHAMWCPEKDLALMDTPDKLYKYHVANLRELDRAFERLARLLRSAVAREDEVVASVLVRIQTLLLGVWAENRLAKLLYEPSGFSSDERDAVRARSTLLERWRYAVELAFRKHYKLPHAKLEPPVLPHSAHGRYSTLAHLLGHDLAPALELRNKLAHGQWVYTLTGSWDSVSSTHMRMLNTENALSLQFKRCILNALSGAIHDLVVSPATFERDFDEHFGQIEWTRLNLKKRSYGDWVDSLRRKYKNGVALRPQRS